MDRSNGSTRWLGPVLRAELSDETVSRLAREDLGEVLVAPAGEADENELRVEVERTGEGVRRLERGDDSFRLAQAMEGGERVVVRRRDVRRAAGVAEPRVLGAYTGIVEPGGDRMRVEDLAVVVRE